LLEKKKEKKEKKEKTCSNISGDIHNKDNNPSSIAK